MVTNWTQGLLDDAYALMMDRKYHSALRALLVILDVYPDQPEALKLASSVARLGHTRHSDARDGEALESRHLFDSRLNPIFCECDAAGCEVSWVSAYHEVEGYASVMINNPLGARCESCGVTLCRRHLPVAGIALDCAQCGRPLNPAPAPNGRRRTNQTPRLNKPLVHVIVVVEGRRPPSAEFMTELFANVTPDVFEDQPRISGVNERKFTDDGYDLGLVYGFAADGAYGTEEYDMRVYPGRAAEGRKTRWVIVKIFQNRPKHVDPDKPATTG